MSCPRCAHLDNRVPIEYEAALREMVGAIKEELEEGTLAETSCWPEGEAEIDQGPFITLRAERPWPDVMIYCFRCTSCDSLYRLSVDTYHGRGGTWTPVSEAAPPRAG